MVTNFVLYFSTSRLGLNCVSSCSFRYHIRTNQKKFPMGLQCGLVLPVLIESESELFTGDTSKDNHSPGPVVREVSP